MSKNIESFRHRKDKRSHIPSREEAGYEAASPRSQEGRPSLQMPKNPVVFHEQDPELLVLQKYVLFDYCVILQEGVRSLYRQRFTRI